MSEFAESLSVVARITLVDSAYDTLLEAITTGRLRGGQVLSEVSLARQLNVSRTPIHEALVRLFADGLVEECGRRGVRVSPFTAGDVVEIYQMRILLESTAAEQAAATMGVEQIAALRAEFDRLLASRDELDWPARAIDLDLRFHDALACSGSGRLRDDIRRYRRLVRGFCRMSGMLKNLRDALDEHICILDAIEKRRPLQARNAMAAHIEARLKVVLRELAGARHPDGSSPDGSSSPNSSRDRADIRGSLVGCSPTGERGSDPTAVGNHLNLAR